MVMIMNSEEFNKVGLYSHNIESYKKIKEAFDKGEKVVGIVHATGTGKSYNALQLAYDNRDKKTIYVAPSLGIIEHIKKTIKDNQELDLQRDFPNLEFRTYQSFINMSEEELKNLNVDLLIVDEFHHLGAPIWGARINKIVETHEHLQIFGMTAYTVRDRGTAYERDMANLETDELFSNKIVSRYDLCDAMIDELLPQPIYKTAYINLLDLEQKLEEKVKSMNLTAKEYQEYMEILDSAKKRIAEAPSIPELIRKNIKKNGKYIYFCPPGSETGTNDIETIKREAIEWFKQYLPEEDIIFYETTSEMGDLGKQNRDAFYNDTTLSGESTNGKLRIMFAINQYNEGVHAPNIDGVIMGRGTTSDIVYFEQLGRALSVRGNTREEFEKYEKCEIGELIQLCKDRDIPIDENVTKEEIIQKLIAPVVIDLTNNFEFIQELENDLKNRVKEIQIRENGNKFSNKIRNVSFDIEVLNNDLFQMLSNLRERLTPLNWNEMYALAEKYYQYYGDLIVPKGFKTTDGINYDEYGLNLGNWIRTQRQNYNNHQLSEERIAKLLEIKMIFSVNRNKWNEMYDLAEKYYRHYGNLEITQSFKTKNGIDYDETGLNLGGWIQDQREVYNYRELSKEKIEKLLKIGMRFEAVFSENVWSEWYALAEKYYRHYGNLEVPLRFKTVNGIDYDESGVALGNWISIQRYRNKIQKVSDERVQKLLKIGMRFDSKVTVRTWEEMYELSEKYYQHYGNLEIPLSFKTINGVDYDENGIRLGNWIGTQRNKYKHNQLSNDKIQKLLHIGMIFRMTVSNGDEMFALAEKYFQHYGNLEVPTNFKTKNGIDYDETGLNLGGWIQNQRDKYKSKKLSKTRMEKLLKIGMRFEAVFSENVWNEWYVLAEKYFQHYGNLKVPLRFKTKNGVDYEENGLNLGNWISVQRKNYNNGNLSEERRSKLEIIGMIWNIRKNKEIIFEECLQYEIDYDKNKDILEHISIQELHSKIIFLIENNMSLINSNGELHEIFTMSDINMEVKYGIKLENIINQYYVEPSKKKGV